MMERQNTAILRDLHVYLVPDEYWRENLNNAINKIISETISLGFIRIDPSTTVATLRHEIADQLGAEEVPAKYFFVRSVGRCLTRMKPSQETEMKAKVFLPPQALCPEVFLLRADPATYGSQISWRSGVTSSESCCSTHQRGVLPPIESRCSEEEERLERIRQEEEEERIRQEEEEEGIRQEEEEERIRQEEEEERIRQEEEEERIRQEEEEERIRQEEEEERIRQKEKERRFKEEEERRRREEIRRRDEERMRIEEEEMRQEEARRIRREEEQHRIEEEARFRMEEEKRKRDELLKKIAARNLEVQKKEEQRLRELELMREKEELVNAIQETGEENRMTEAKLLEMSRKLLFLNQTLQRERLEMRQEWKKLFLEEKKSTRGREDQLARLKLQRHSGQTNKLGQLRGQLKQLQEDLATGNPGKGETALDELKRKLHEETSRIECAELREKIDLLTMKITTEMMLAVQASEELKFLKQEKEITRKLKLMEAKCYAR